MAEKRALTVAALALALVGCRRVTFTRDVAPLVYARCAPCHHAGGAAPFSLIGYDEVRARARQIARVTERRYMPPWKAVGHPVAYANDRGLTDEEIARLHRWAEAGAPRGDGDVPPPPRFTAGWQLGTPDVTIELPAPYALAADGPDVYRNFVLPSGVTGARFVKAWELQPRSPTVHHAILNLDRHGFARARDAADPGPGYAGMDPGEVQAPDGFYLVWTPGQPPTPPADGMAWPLDAATDLVLQLHMQPSGKPEAVAPVIGLYFADGPPTRARFTLRIGDGPIEIAPGARFTMRDRFVLPVDVELLALFPHAHYLAQKMRAWAVEPDGAVRSLLAIDDWDPRWQSDYVLLRPLPLGRGSRLEMEFIYDNSESNPRNPNRPPARVVTGERSVDEMGNITLQLGVPAARDKLLLREAKYRAQTERGGNARSHYNLGNALGELGRPGEAAAEYRRALALDPALMPAQLNLGGALMAEGRLDEAIAQLERVIALAPGSAPAHSNLGDALAQKGQLDRAIARYREALALDPGFAPARHHLENAERLNRP
jgi:hypothetical protein